ncbi:CPBP family intramembrane glutamic endopeptidase [Mesobacillus foraminis]|uniref:CAAX prenyl protease-like protein n=1 Tax=Mesobacillus foraminis TaxID=279826 RepID=A0A4R2BHZ3_9BACI|nr:CPBP family intramembrane glutamic endopeptidase [Mesobacillus foraminis]TCN26185.1 CAAX prenyl protease-like protein [Mesobacillus foraminis]
MKTSQLGFRISLFLATICLLAGFFVVPYQMESIKTFFGVEEYEKVMDSLQMPFPLLILLTSPQVFVVSLILGFTGYYLAKSAGFRLVFFENLVTRGKKAVLNANSVLLAAGLGILSGLIIQGSDRFFFMKHIPKLQESSPEFNVIGLLAGIFYGGILEEVMMRLFVMSLLVWVIMKVLRYPNGTPLPTWVYWSGIILAAGVFAVGHLPATEQLFGEITSVLLFRCFLLNGIAGIFFGYLYWKKGLEYSMISHMISHISSQLLFIPLFY